MGVRSGEEVAPTRIREGRSGGVGYPTPEPGKDPGFVPHTVPEPPSITTPRPAPSVCHRPTLAIPNPGEPAVSRCSGPRSLAPLYQDDPSRHSQAEEQVVGKGGKGRSEAMG
jgi:hypothetical protein